MINRNDARIFFLSGTYRPLCELIDLDPDWIAMVLRKYAGIECAVTGSKAT